MSLFVKRFVMVVRSSMLQVAVTFSAALQVQKIYYRLTKLYNLGDV
jgi:hypothetical protein